MHLRSKGYPLKRAIYQEVINNASNILGLPVMDSTISGPVSSGSSSAEFLPAWLLAAAVIGGLVVVSNILICIVYIRRKRWCRSPQEGEFLFIYKSLNVLKDIKRTQ